MKWMLRIVRNWTPTHMRSLVYRTGQFFRSDEQVEFPSVEGALGALDAWGFRPRTMIDVGAYHGK